MKNMHEKIYIENKNTKRIGQEKMKQNKILTTGTTEINNRDVMGEICNATLSHGDHKKRRNIPNPHLKESTIPYIFVECFLMLIFSVLVNGKCNFWTSIFCLTEQYSK
jgi:hypothetical protein